MYLLVSRVISENHCFFLEKKKKNIVIMLCFGIANNASVVKSAKEI